MMKAREGAAHPAWHSMLDLIDPWAFATEFLDTKKEFDIKEL
jgi:hypothetical protein